MSLKRTKIVATLGPATHTEEIIAGIINAGVDVVRLNFSHGSYADHALLIERVRQVATTIKKPIAILQDLQGPKIRLGKLPDAGVAVNDNDTIIFDTIAKEYADSTLRGDSVEPSSLQADSIFPVDFSELHEHVKSGERLLINDGRIQTKIIAVNGTQISATVLHGGLLSSHKGINVPDSKITVSAITPKDRADAEFGVLQGVDYIALSFVRSANDINELRAIISLADKNSTAIKIIAKMERPEAVANQAAIITVADGIMVARGDLGIEIDAAEVPIVQKELIEAARIAGKPVIVATQMLDSMQDSPQPTRAEVNDVANAVIDHADAVMLSNESATGHYPFETVQIMADIIRTTEASKYDDVLPDVENKSALTDDVLSELVRLASQETIAKAILTVSFDGQIARHISRCRPQVPIIVVTNDDRVTRQLALNSGVYAITKNPQNSDEALAVAMQYALDLGLVIHGDTIVAAFGEPFNSAHTISVLKVKAV
ncbi:MAG: pyruvate kinase [Candidatus Magasanikbacteria bacterium RIFCSPHIGHO2_01_FULL_41_23]|uniref:Pyruvate kinase n=1 Tax=Candidatus Magasanikbacteria bacterium RIFCSPLOWO2_01_FULL_40_15 TaxID=1798686 RepID=A0A1F6N2D3_9BACT|nr:MAG: pyruvate kinase [Candidatus Magasanikbacteria bacterium RIFCSPHIGHO2_01_FULL_41_23]OGH67246.1 MAG: pyruvate kinase [Candidatus Magasanikbacteria bacterium RIFCSPHIGHO2_02_FULL_41_35]OGH77813.1 MAG: pyruvate kinase [Candidatus Magasanikbacteria bacterium RIFCSPLOWO2_01_FULL_40_15]